MRRIFQYLMQQKKAALIIFIVLILQAVCELALPQYTSNIVDTGIAKNGIEDVLPACIREEQLENIELFVFGDDLDTIKESYEVIDYDGLSDAEQKSYKKKYPDIETMTLYELTADEDTVADIKESFITAEALISTLEGEGKDVSQFAALPEENRQALVAKVKSKMEDVTDSSLDTMGTTFVAAEYEAIGMNIESIQTHYILTAGAKMVVVSLLAGLAALVVGFFASRAGASIGRDLRGRVFKKVVHFSGQEMDCYSTASLITRSTNDIQQVQMVIVLMLRMVLYAPILGLGGVLKVLSINTSMAWIIAIAVIAVLCIVTFLFVVAMPKFKLMQTLVDRVNLVTREILTGIPVIRAFSTEKHEEKRFDEANKDLTRTMLFTNRTMSVMMPSMMLVINGVTLAIVWFGAKGIDTGSLQVGEMMALITYSMQIIMSFLMITMISVFLPRAGVAANRIQEVLDTEITLAEPEEPKNLNHAGKKTGLVEFDHVYFKYPDADGYTLEDITFTAKPGETTAFIGSTGSGKSTLVNLVPRFYDVTKGSIKVNGVNVKDVTFKDLRDKLGFVPQKAVLFSGTIESNLKYGKEDATIEEVKKAAEIAQATEFIELKDEKYESPIAQGGNNVSGGQKQRLSIARAVAKNPEIFVFDDSFSALDFKTDAALRSALHKETKGSTVLLVAQRISTIMNADQIVVLDEGKIAGIGKHEELLKNCEVYYQIATSQLSEEELKQHRGDAQEGVIIDE